MWYNGLENIKQWLHGEPALKKNYKTETWTLTLSSATLRHFIRQCILYNKIAVSIIFHMAACEPVYLLWGRATTFTLKIYFWRIVSTHKYLGTHDLEKVSKSAKNNPAWELSYHSRTQLFESFRTAEQIYTFKLIFTPCSPLLVLGILALAKIWHEWTYEHQCSFHRQCIIDLSVFSPKTCQTVANNCNGFKQLCPIMANNIHKGPY